MRTTHQTLEEVLTELAYLNETKDLWCRHPRIVISQNEAGDFENRIRVDHWFSEGDPIIVCDPDIGSEQKWLATVESIQKAPLVTVVAQDGDRWDVESVYLQAASAGIDQVQSHPTNTCPKCGHSEIEGGGLLHDFDEVRHRVHCLNCGHRWQEIFVFHKLEDDGKEVHGKIPE